MLGVLHDQTLGDGKAEPGAFLDSLGGGADLTKRVENAFPLIEFLGMPMPVSFTGRW